MYNCNYYEETDNDISNTTHGRNEKYKTIVGRTEVKEHRRR